MYRYLRSLLDIKNAYVQENGHEAFPIVSELWHHIMSRKPILEARRLKHLSGKLSKDMWKYLNNSEMFPPKLNASFNGYTRTKESVNQVLAMHMEKCTRSAIILGENMAIPVYTHLIVKKKPAYFGKDVITGNLGGYKFSGYFPTHVFLSSKHYFQSGITEWWVNYFRWVLMVKTRAAEIKLRLSSNKNDSTLYHESGSGNVGALVCLPVIGLIVSMLVFIVFDNVFLRRIFDFLRKQLSRLKKVFHFIGT